ncbi:calcium-activated chloride channel regulator 1-like isoform X1 [Styela clava]
MISYHLTVIVCLFQIVNCFSSQTVLVDNGYRGVVVAIHPNVTEDQNLIDDIKNMMVDASADLFEATHKRAYFKEITILIPKTWTVGNYTDASKESYKSADIRIEKSEYEKNTPYAWTYLGCGLGGMYIHLTSDYVSLDLVADNYGPRGKAVVHEWGHYRWGVFDEYPVNDDQAFYLAALTGVEATRCPRAISGTYQGVCNITNPLTFLPYPTCSFEEDDLQPTGLKTSMMYKQFLDKVSTFCHNNSSDPINLHNEEANNTQNTICDYQSTWDVILQSVDFRNDVNLPNLTLSDTIPEFKILRAVPGRIIFVMDVSGSMAADMKLNHLRSVVNHFIKDVVSTGSYVGLVSFQSTSLILAQLTEISDTNSRNYLTALLPRIADGGTGIGSGILKGIEVLESDGQDAAGALVVVLTDGEENEKPTVATVSSVALTKNVFIQTVFIGVSDTNVNEDLETLSKQTGGDWYYSDGTSDTTSQLINIIAALTKSKDGDLSSESIQLVNRNENLKPGRIVSSTVAIDGSVGKNTVFTFTWDIQEPTIEITPPGQSCIYSNRISSQKNYCDGSPIHEVEEQFSSVRFVIPETVVKSGIWEYTIQSSVSDESTVTVTSTATTGGNPVTVEAKILSSDVSQNKAAVIIAEVFRNSLPVLGASVNATVVRPDGTTSDVILLDNGKGADFKRDDGVYSKYYSNFNSKGRYYVEVQVFKDDASHKGDETLGSRSALRNGTFEQGDTQAASIDGPLQRVASSPGLAYTGSVSTSDTIPPNKIIDLEAKQADLSDASIGLRLSFTSPGDDYDSGTASRYEIRYSYGSSKQMRTEFASQNTVTDDMITKGNLSQPKPNTNFEEFSLILKDLPQNENSVRVAFAMRAFDESANPSEISNIAMVTFFIVPPSIPTTTTTTTTTTGTATSTAISTTTAKEVLEPNDDRLGLLLGVILGAIGATSLLILAVVFYCRRRRALRKQNEEAHERTYENLHRI